MYMDSPRTQFRGFSALALLYGAINFGCDALDDPAAPQGHRLIPTDERQAIRASSPPPPLSGGTLLVTASGNHAVVGDEARDRLSVVDLRSRNWLGDVKFPEGSEPGRLVEGSNGLIHVVLRKTGLVASVRLSDLSVVRESEVCPSPRGIAYDASVDQLYVACVSGRFMTLGSAGEVLRSVQLPNDLRDVVVENGNLWVSRFRSAEVLRLDGAGSVVETLAPPTVVRSRIEPDTFTQSQARFEPGVGWRLQANPAGGVVLVHQRATTEEIAIEPNQNGGAYGGGGGGDCSGIQRSAITSFRAGGQVLSGPDVPVSLPVDVAVRFDGQAVIAGAGRMDFDAPKATFVSNGGFSSGGFASPELGISTVNVMGESECSFGESLFMNEPNPSQQYVVAVAVQPNANERYLVQTREPAQLLLVSPSLEPFAIQLGGDSVADTGFDLFHRTAEAGLSCASCHPDGTDDGHVWNFAGQGPRRTQPLDISLAGTAPFHWDGSLPEVSDLMGEVFVNRMGGVHQGPERLSALTDWLFHLEAPPAEVAVDDEMVFRGRRLFESIEVGCADCHRGASFTDNNSYDVGTGPAGERFQVPSLLGIGSRSRLIHDGCAGSLRERFAPECGGGDKHGKVSLLSATDIDDMVAYLETL